MSEMPPQPPDSPAEIQAQWQNEFPGATYTIQTLRHRLGQAHIYLLRTEFELDQLRLELNATGLPSRHWNARTHRQIKFLHHLKSQADRDFHRALKALQSTQKHSTQKPFTYKQTMPEPPPPPPPPPPPKALLTLFQTAHISVVDGKTITTVLDFDAAHWLRIAPIENVGFYARQLSFENLIVPTEYQYALTHKGKSFEPCRCITIRYPAEEFLRLCRLEVQTDTGHLLDGARHDHRVLI